VGRDQDGVGLDTANDFWKPLRDSGPQVGKSDAWTVRRRCEVIGVVGQSDHREPESVRGQDHRGSGPVDIPPGADEGDPRTVQIAVGVEQCLSTEVQRVVVGQRDAIDPEMNEGLHGLRRSSEEEGLSRIRPRISPIRDAAFQVEHEEICFPGCLDDLPSDQRLRWL
jgi:hypothetical protein